MVPRVAPLAVVKAAVFVFFAMSFRLMDVMTVTPVMNRVANHDARRRRGAMHWMVGSRPSHNNLGHGNEHSRGLNDHAWNWNEGRDVVSDLHMMKRRSDGNAETESISASCCRRTPYRHDGDSDQ